MIGQGIVVCLGVCLSMFSGLASAADYMEEKGEQMGISTICVYVQVRDY